MRLNKGIPTLPSLFYSNPNPDRNGICNPNPDRNGIWVGRHGSGVLGGPTGFRHQESGIKYQASGFRGQCSTYKDYFTVLLFYFLKKKLLEHWNK